MAITFDQREKISANEKKRRSGCHFRCAFGDLWM